MNMLNTLDGVRDETGASMTPWAEWTRKWTAEENRHGDAMNKCVPVAPCCAQVATSAAQPSSALRLTPGPMPQVPLADGPRQHALGRGDHPEPYRFWYGPED